MVNITFGPKYPVAVVASALCVLLLIAIPALATYAQSTNPPTCPDPGVCFISQEAKDRWAEEQGCAFPDAPENQRCTEEWRLDETFLDVSEGRLVLVGYVPRRNGKILGQSGVTISTGVDLGQQSASGTRNILNSYITEHGDRGVDVDELMTKLNPYFGLHKEEAAAALAAQPLTVTQAEAEFLARAFKLHFKKRVAAQFDRGNDIGATFKSLPSAAQTVIMDFAYQYGLSDSRGDIRSTFWSYVYDGRWFELAVWLSAGPDIYRNRRKREGDLLMSGIDDQHLPRSGSPCRNGG